MSKRISARGNTDSISKLLENPIVVFPELADAATGAPVGAELVPTGGQVTVRQSGVTIARTNIAAWGTVAEVTDALPTVDGSIVASERATGWARVTVADGAVIPSRALIVALGEGRNVEMVRHYTDGSASVAATADATQRYAYTVGDQTIWFALNVEIKRTDIPNVFAIRAAFTRETGREHRNVSPVGAASDAMLARLAAAGILPGE